MYRTFCAAGGCQVACSPAANYSQTLQPTNVNGTVYYLWPDINYKDQTLSNWFVGPQFPARIFTRLIPPPFPWDRIPAQHLERTVALYRAYLCNNCSSTLYHNATLLQAATNALSSWVSLNLTPPQWWWIEIGVPGGLWGERK